MQVYVNGTVMYQGKLHSNTALDLDDQSALQLIELGVAEKILGVVTDTRDFAPNQDEQSQDEPEVQDEQSQDEPEVQPELIETETEQPKRKRR